jgi:hypothetical protein
MLKFKGVIITKLMLESALCVAEGLNNAEIAAKFSVPKHAAEGRICRLYEALGLNGSDHRRLVLLCLELKEFVEKIGDDHDN